MEKRPNIVSDHEKVVEREIQQARKERDREMVQKMKKVGKLQDEPIQLSFSRGPVQHEVPPEAQAWIEDEAKIQLGHYRRICREQEALEPHREEWCAEFFERITGPRGFSVHAGNRRTIKPEEMPIRPNRRWRVVL
jgi:hypothetical protein